MMARVVGRWPAPWSRGRVRVNAKTALVIVLAAAALLRLAVVGRQPLWADELFSLAMATGHSLEHPADSADPTRGDFVESPRPEPAAAYSRYLEHEDPPARMSRVLRAVFLSDTSPPLYYVLLSAWTRVLGTGDRALRLFSVAASLGTLLLLASLARRAGGRPSVVPAVALFAASPMAVHYSTEGRMYALLWLWVVAALVLVLRLRVRGGRPELLGAYAAVGAAGLLTHYFFLPVWLVAAGWLFMHPGRCRRGRLLLALALAAAVALPWYVQVPRSLHQWRVTGQWLKVLPEGYHPILTRLSLAWSVLSIRTAEGVPWFLDVVNGAALLIVLALAVRRRGRRLVTARRGLLWLAAAAAVGTPIALDVMMGTYMSAVPRYGLAALPPTLALVALAVTAVHPRHRGLVTALLVVLALAGTWRVQRSWARSNEPFAQVAWFVATEARAPDVVVAHSIPSGVCGVARYMVRSGTALRAPLISWVGQLRRGEGPYDLDTVAPGRRILLVDIHPAGDGLPLAAWLVRGMHLVSTHSFGSATVHILEGPTPIGTR
jgi:hypothetical protein